MVIIWGEGYINRPYSGKYFPMYLYVCVCVCMCVCVCVCVCTLSHFSHVWLFVTLWTVAWQAPLSIGFSRQEYWSGLPCPPPGDLPIPGIEPTSLMSPALAGGFFTSSATKIIIFHILSLNVYNVICQLCLNKAEGKKDYERKPAPTDIR